MTENRLSEKGVLGDGGHEISNPIVEEASIKALFLQRCTMTTKE